MSPDHTRPDFGYSDRRKRVLTEDDVKALVEALREHSACNSFTDDEITIMKRLIKTFDKATGIIGTVILVAIVTAVIAVFTKGFWIAIATGAKAGGLGK